MSVTSKQHYCMFFSQSGCAISKTFRTAITPGFGVGQDA